MLCPKCGNQINDSAKFCDACGSSINSFSMNNQGGLLSRRKRKSEELNNNEGKISESDNDINQSNNMSNNGSNINIVEEVKIVQNNETVDFSKIKKNRNFVIYLILTFLTGGLYMIYFWWGFIKDMNLICGEEGESPNSILVLIFSVITCGIYYFYWMYKHSERIKNTAPRYNVRIKQSSESILLWAIVGTIFAFGFGILLGQYFMINNFNKLTNAIKGE